MGIYIIGLTLGPNKVTEVVTDHPFRLTMAALEIDEGKSRRSFDFFLLSCDPA